MDLINLIAALATIILFFFGFFKFGVSVGKGEPLILDIIKKLEKVLNIKLLKTVTPDKEKKPSEKEFYFGIDVGSDHIDYCILDYQEFERISKGHDSTKVIIDSSTTFRGSVENPASKKGFDAIYKEIEKIITELLSEANQRKNFPISGIGIGLPGMVEPKSGKLRQAPYLGKQGVEFVEKLDPHIDWRRFPKKPELADFIKIDNDVRCATRFRWKATSQKNLLCILIGNGVGSGIVLDGKMIYGTNFCAGEAGHTTISHTPELFKGNFKRCNCRKEGHHWEMYVASYGVINMMENFDPQQFEAFKKEYVPTGEKLTTTLIQKAYEKGNPYATQIVEDKFLEYVAIGVSNYINILNPEKIFLGGGMIRAFVSDKNEEKLKNKIRDKYTLDVNSDVAVSHTENQYLASIGAALIFKDETYFKYLQEKI